MQDMQVLKNDQAMREEALLPTQSFIVQAPAGSGKTGLLIQRFLVLLAHCKVPEECLAITFTRKAAFEMRHRILCSLQRAKDPVLPSEEYEKRTWLLAREVLMRDQHLGWDLLYHPSRLKIQTIDSFCTSIAHQMPIVSQFGSTPSIIEDANHLYALAARNLLKSLDGYEPYSKSLSVLLAHLDNNIHVAERLLSGMLSHRDQWLPYLGRSFFKQKARSILENGLQIVIADILQELRTKIPQGFEDIFELVQYAAKELVSLGRESLICHCRDLANEWPGGNINDLLVWQGLAELLLTQDYAWRRTVTEQQGFPSPAKATHKTDKAHFKLMKERMADCLNRLQEYHSFRECLQQVRQCPPMNYQDSQWQMVEALVELLPVLTAELSLVFQEKGGIDFIEVTLGALKALGSPEAPTDLALGLDYKIRHILVDEFQDTSLAQFRLLEQLTAGWLPGDGRTLFLVGDPMQSIYRFRQAEVGLFIRAKQKGIGGIHLRSLNLSTNFRSDPKIIEWTNLKFKDQFPLQENMASGAVVFHPSVAARESYEGAQAILQSVTLETEANVIVNLIKTLQIEEPHSSIAILVRARSHLQKILPSLRQAQIKYHGVQLELLSERPIVQDLVCLTKSLLHLGDRIAWLALLRTPWIAASLSDLLLIANYDPSLPIWHALQSYFKIIGLESSTKQRLSVVVPILSQALHKIQRLPLRKWIMETWKALGGASALYDVNTVEDVETFFSILDEEQNFDFYEVGFLERRIQSLYADTTAPSEGSVQIMTIHKAKGLEFETVIMPGMGRRSIGDPAKLLLWEEGISILGKNYFILAPIKAIGAEKDPIYHYLKNRESTRAAFEAIRLLYVGTTRARKRLYCLTHQENILDNNDGQ